jgi:hypothetical protein
MLRALTLATILLRLASATCYGPTACLSGWVWRQADAADQVCVTPAVRAQTAADNAAAASRATAGGACVSGYVWREAYPGDEVCVLPATRTQAASDNAAAADRAASLRVWFSSFYPEGETLYPYYRINGDHFNPGTVQAALYNTDGTVFENWQSVTAAAQYGYVGGFWYVEWGVQNCTMESAPGTTTGYAIAQDMTSGCYSEKIPANFCSDY